MSYPMPGAAGTNNKNDNNNNNNSQKPSGYGFDQSDQAQQTPKRKSTMGRILTRWNPSMDQLVLLSVFHIVNRDHVDLRWSDVATVANEAQEPTGSLSGDAIKQHLIKLQGDRRRAEQPVPEELERSKYGNKRKNKQLLASTPVKKKKKSGPQVPPTPAMSRNNSKAGVAKDEHDREEEYVPAAPRKMRKPNVPKTSSLLYIPENERKKAAANKTSSKAATQKQETQEYGADLDDDADDEDFKVDPEDIEDASPSKKPAPKKSKKPAHGKGKGKGGRTGRKALPLNADCEQTYVPPGSFTAPPTSSPQQQTSMARSAGPFTFIAPAVSPPEQIEDEQPDYHMALREQAPVDYSDINQGAQFDYDFGASASLSPDEQGGLTQSLGEAAFAQNPFGYQQVVPGAFNAMALNGMGGGFPSGMMDPATFPMAGEEALLAVPRSMTMLQGGEVDYGLPPDPNQYQDAGMQQFGFGGPEVGMDMGIGDFSWETFVDAKGDYTTSGGDGSVFL